MYLWHWFETQVYREGLALRENESGRARSPTLTLSREYLEIYCEYLSVCQYLFANISQSFHCFRNTRTAFSLLDLSRWFGAIVFLQRKWDTFSRKEKLDNAEWVSVQLAIIVVCTSNRFHFNVCWSFFRHNRMEFDPFKVVNIAIISAMRHLHDQMNHMQHARFQEERVQTNQNPCSVAPPTRPVRVCGGLRRNKTL